MEHPYQPKYPRAKLKEIVLKHLKTFRLAGLSPNCSVDFGASGGEVRGWLLEDPRQRPAEVRYLLLDDGDVWREVDGPGQDGVLQERLWLLGPDDDLVTLLIQAQNDARRGGRACLVPEERVDLARRSVADRRTSRAPHDGPDRRHGS